MRLIHISASLVNGVRCHKPHSQLTIFLASFLCFSCGAGSTSQGDIQNNVIDVEAEADALYLALEETANARMIPITRRDTSLRRLTSEWIQESPEVRRRYFLGVVILPAGLAMRVHILRQSQSIGDDGESWNDLPGNEETGDEEVEIVEEANELWENRR